MKQSRPFLLLLYSFRLKFNFQLTFSNGKNFRHQRLRKDDFWVNFIKMEFQSDCGWSVLNLSNLWILRESWFKLCFSRLRTLFRISVFDFFEVCWVFLLCLKILWFSTKGARLLFTTTIDTRSRNESSVNVVDLNSHLVVPYSWMVGKCLFIFIDF